MSDREFVAHVVELEPISSPIPKLYWDLIKQIYVGGGIALAATAILMMVFSNALTEAGLQQLALTVLAYEFYVLGATTLVWVGYFWPVSQFSSRNKPPTNIQNPIFNELQYTARYGVSSRGYGLAVVLRALIPIFTIGIVFSYLVHFTRHEAITGGGVFNELLFETSLVFFMGWANIYNTSLVKYQVVARRFVQSFSRLRSP